MILSALMVLLYLIDEYVVCEVNIGFKNIVIFALIVANTLTVQAQPDYATNNNYDHFLVNPGALIPSAYSDTSSILHLQYRGRTGLLKDIYSIYADYITHSNKSSFGVKAFSQRETKLFASSKAFVVYAISIPLSQKWSFSAGTQAGLSNVYFGSSRASGGSSSWVADGSISTSLRNRTWQFHAAIHQIPENKHEFVNASLRLPRYYDFILGHNIMFSLDWNLDLAVRTWVLEDQYGIYIDSKINYRNHGSLHLGLANSRNITAGISYNYPHGLNLIQLFFSHRFGSSANPINASINNIGVHYIFNALK